MSYAIVTDSASDLPLSYFENNDVLWLPLGYGIDDQNFFATMQPSDSEHLIERMEAGAMTRTAQVPLEKYVEAWSALAEQGKDIINISLSSGLSGTYNASCMARDIVLEKYPNIKLFTIDSLGACMGQGLLVIAAQNLRDSGKSIEETVAWLEEHKLEVQHWFSPRELTYLKRGGRVSSTQALIGSMLNIKPVMDVNKDGKLIPVDKVKGRKRALEFLAQATYDNIINPEGQTIYITQANCLEDAEKLASLIQEKLPMVKTEILPLGTIMISHTGPGLIAIFSWGKKRID